MFLSALNKYPEVELLDHIVVLFLIFWVNSIFFQQRMYQITLLPTVYKCSLSSTFLLLIFFSGHSERCEVISHCGFYLHLPSDWRRWWHPTPVLLPGKSHGRRSLVGCSPWGRWGSDTTKRLHFHFSLPCIGEGNGNPLQCSCLENPRDGGSWWAALYGVAQSRTRLKRLSSSSPVISD